MRIALRVNQRSIRVVCYATSLSGASPRPQDARNDQARDDEQQRTTTPQYHGQNGESLIQLSAVGGEDNGKFDRFDCRTFLFPGGAG